jgi:hypothetical protein
MDVALSSGQRTLPACSRHASPTKSQPTEKGGVERISHTRVQLSARAMDFVAGPCTVLSKISIGAALKTVCSSFHCPLTLFWDLGVSGFELPFAVLKSS